MFSSSKKPYTAISVQIDHMTDDHHKEDDLSGIIDLIESIRLQQTGPTEAARAIRKKLKYGGPHQQVRALVILDGLIQNAGNRFQTTFADEPLLERLRLMARDDSVETRVRQRLSMLLQQWTAAYRNTPGLSQIATLSSQLPTTKRAPPKKYSGFGDEEAPQSPVPSHSRHASENTKSPKQKTPKTTPSRPNKKFDLNQEKFQMQEFIGQASKASVNLLNSLQLINRETQRVSDSQLILDRVSLCKKLRKQILYYIQQVESDDWLGSLIHANDELVKALVAFDIMDKSIDDDSDSDVDAGAQSTTKSQRAEDKMAKLSLGGLPPPRPQRHRDDDQDEDNGDDDEDNPFGDSNAIKTPTERPGMTLKTV